MEKNSRLEKMFEKARSIGWTVTEEDGSVYDFAKYSPAGQDFHISVHTENDPALFMRNLLEVHDTFDVSQEAYYWLDDSGHGMKGAPYDMKDVYEDMEACKDMIYQLYTELEDLDDDENNSER